MNNHYNVLFVLVFLFSSVVVYSQTLPQVERISFTGSTDPSTQPNPMLTFSFPELESFSITAASVSNVNLNILNRLRDLPKLRVIS
ncbi:hypothetical protein DFA_09625 [Cavenderia fasciculata]|uniref:Uncharacterized protein n=1 Tax=Cavenderia fasciculata TaxID=261658 RepID=F4Q854_CACFS|nr:uncharacterized protein DFA_09625 [Cavenderia fasciculata]EGG15954.1 hypothetical protein DFA_09625 [Cavenderia fasciculata]|eukprot:XP_004352279.1 hypothetical protein DFA_09625 [Cavenderia fasciculata]